MAGGIPSDAVFVCLTRYTPLSGVVVHTGVELMDRFREAPLMHGSITMSCGNCGAKWEATFTRDNGADFYDDPDYEICPECGERSEE